MIEAFFAGIGVQDDLAMTGGEFNQFFDNRFAEPCALATRMYRNIADVGAIYAAARARPTPTISPLSKTKHL